MNILEEEDDTGTGIPNAVGTVNATEDVFHHVKPGRKRANFFRYFYFNLPKLTKALLMLTIAAIGGSATIVALSDHPPFPHGEIALWLVVAFTTVYLAMAIFTRRAIWDFGSFISLGACVVYIGGIIDNAPFVWNGASIPLAASWNLMLFASLGYFILNWAVNMRIFVVWPDSQGFTD
ncbi:MAG: hypothetical protein Q4P66_05550 [Actinomycetaceae bacterium]|nr:hypothetical protein [Actinomycetaceae bacterium]